MQHAWKHWTDDLALRLSDQLETAVDPKEIVLPPDRSLGDFAFGCFRLAKEKKIAPAVLAQEIAAAFDRRGSDVESVSAAGPYVNFTFSIGKTTHRVIQDVEGSEEKYGASEQSLQGTVLLEYGQVNTHKEIHVGHLRNFVLGVSLNRLLQMVGAKTIPVTYHGDVGAHVAKCLWYLVKQHELPLHALRVQDVEALLAKIPAEERTGKYLGELYTNSTALLEENEQGKEEVSFVLQKLESHDAAWEALWQETRQWSLREMKEIFAELEMPVERQYLESEVVERGQAIVDDLLKKNIAKLSQGATVVDLEDAKLGIFLIRKSDGTSLYATKDLALAELKFHEYPKTERSIHLVDNRQAFYFKQLFETLHRMGFEKPLEFVGYEFVTLTDGAMSSRKGNIITYQDFYEAVLEYALREIETRHEDWSAEKKTEIARAISMAGIKFGMLKQDNDKVYTFDMEQALSFDGATGPYCQYATTRLGSILRKANVQPKMEEPLTQAFHHASEKALALMIAMFPEKVALAAKELRSSVIAQWCVEMAQTINEFYRDVPVLQSSGELLEGRLRLTSVARSVLTQGLGLLGIPVPEEM